MINIYSADCLDVLAKMATEQDEPFIQTVVTSPPYYGLRSYRVGQTRWPKITMVAPAPGMANFSFDTSYGRLGEESDPWEFVARLVHVFRLVRKVLRDDGTVWLNLNSSYARSGAAPFAHKNLIPIPWMVTMAMQADGWTFRRDIIWHKSGLPEKATDRPTGEHEYILLFSKSETYSYDWYSIARARKYGEGVRNIRTVWRITNGGYSGEHTATFPEEVPRRCIKAGTPEAGNCPECGRPYRRLLEKTDPVPAPGNPNAAVEYTAGGAASHGAGATTLHMDRLTISKGWIPTCDHDYANARPSSWVLDPFAGAGTTGLAASKLGRNAILIEKSPVVAEEAAARITTPANPLFQERINIYNEFSISDTEVNE